MFGMDVAAVMLPSELLTEDRVSRMNALWDLLGEREALVIAVKRAQRTLTGDIARRLFFSVDIPARAR